MWPPVLSASIDSGGSRNLTINTGADRVSCPPFRLWKKSGRTSSTACLLPLLLRFHPPQKSSLYWPKACAASFFGHLLSCEADVAPSSALLTLSVCVTYLSSRHGFSACPCCALETPVSRRGFPAKSRRGFNPAGIRRFPVRSGGRRFSALPAGPPAAFGPARRKGRCGQRPDSPPAAGG